MAGYGSRIYASLAVKDVFRLWSASQLQIIIVAGICLPILMLLGLKNGHVAELREDLVTSPTGRQVIFWSAKNGDFLSPEVLADLSSSISNVQVIIPESQRVVFVGGDGTSGDGEKSSLTLYGTLPGDPLLEQFGADVGEFSEGPFPIILASSTAERLGLGVGDGVVVEIRRRVDREEQSHALSMSVSAVVPSSEESSGMVAFVHLRLMELLEVYGAGQAVSELGIPAMESLRAVDTYQEMLVICFRGEAGDLSERDHEFLKERGLVVEEVTEAREATLFGTLKDSSADELRVYRLRFDGDSADGQVIRDSPELLARNTEAEDDLFLRWVPPTEVVVGEQSFRVVGMTLPNRKQSGGWIQNYIQDGGFWFTYDETVKHPLSIRGGNDALNAVVGKDLKFGESLTLQLQELASEGDGPEDAAVDVGSASDASAVEAGGSGDGGKPTFYVPVSLLAFARQADAGEVQVEATARKFVPATQEVSFTKARLYTDTIDDVPAAADVLVDRRYAVLSEVSRIAEIQEQDSSLRTLVLVVSLGVFVFGVITVFSVLLDSTDRKKGMIGILRVMGVPASGVFYVLVIRAVVIGVFAGALCSGVGVLLAVLLSSPEHLGELGAWVPRISIILGAPEYAAVCVGALLCASLGVLVPAIKASRLDPFVAIMEGQFH